MNSDQYILVDNFEGFISLNMQQYAWIEIYIWYVFIQDIIYMFI